MGHKRKKMTDRYWAHERAARMYSRLGKNRKAVAHAKRARSLRFGAVPPVESIIVSGGLYRARGLTQT